MNEHTEACKEWRTPRPGQGRRECICGLDKLPLVAADETIVFDNPSYIAPPAEPHTLMERVAELERRWGTVDTKMAALQGILAARDHGFTMYLEFQEQLETWAWEMYVEEKKP